MDGIQQRALTEKINSYKHALTDKIEAYVNDVPGCSFIDAKYYNVNSIEIHYTGLNPFLYGSRNEITIETVDRIDNEENGFDVVVKNLNKRLQTHKKYHEYAVENNIQFPLSSKSVDHIYISETLFNFTFKKPAIVKEMMNGIGAKSERQPTEYDLYSAFDTLKNRVQQMNTSIFWANFKYLSETEGHSQTNSIKIDFNEKPEIDYFCYLEIGEKIEIMIYQDLLKFKYEIPETIMSSMIGRQMKDIIQIEKSLDNRLIEDIKTVDGNIEIRLSDDKKPIGELRKKLGI
jgi:hypothetical protein